jgi:hypothetical protein
MMTIRVVVMASTQSLMEELSSGLTCMFLYVIVILLQYVAVWDMGLFVLKEIGAQWWPRSQETGAGQPECEKVGARVHGGSIRLKKGPGNYSTPGRQDPSVAPLGSYSAAIRPCLLAFCVSLAL